MPNTSTPSSTPIEANTEPSASVDNTRRNILRGIAAGTVAVGVVAAAPGQEAQAATSPYARYVNTPLWKGKSGTAVKSLQTALGMPTRSRDGIFGPGTKAAVIAYQKKRRLPATGTVNNATWRALAGMPTAAAEASAKAAALAKYNAQKAQALKLAAAAKARADAAARAKAAAAAVANGQATARAANDKRRAALLVGATTSPHTPGLALAADPAWNLIRKVTYGPTPGMVAEVRKIGTTAWLEQQLNPASINDSVCDKIISDTWPLLQTPGKVLWTMKNSYGQIMGTAYSNYWLRRSSLARRIFTKRQVLEMVTEMWHDHLHVQLGSEKVYGDMPTYDALIRKHAFGTFEDMLQAVTISPAMLRYLDNATSRKTSPNENLGRELLELHTVGAGQFTEADVKQSSLILTGHSADALTREYLYRDTWHHVGPVKVMGFSHANATAAGGPAVLTAYLSYLANHPATARRIAEKMCRRFVSDTPSAALIDAVAATFTANKTAIVPTLRFLFNHAEFKASTGKKFRRPDEYIAAVYRAGGPSWVAPTLGTGIDVGGVTYPCNQIWSDHTRLNMEPLAWAPPNGYPDVAPAWQTMSGFVIRANVPYALINNFDKTVKVTDWRTKFGITATMSAYQVVDVLTEAITGFPFKTAHRDNLASFLWDVNKTVPPFTDPVGDARLTARLAELIRLILASPYMNLR